MEKRDLSNLRVGFIGGGNMAKAIGGGLIKKDILKPQNLLVSARTEETLKFWKDLDTRVTFENSQVAEESDVIFLSIKPQMFDEVLLNLKSKRLELKNKLWISILVGVSSDTLYSRLSTIDSNPSIIRAIPNTPLMVGEGITAYCTRNTTPTQEWITNQIFSFLGIIKKVPESQMIPIGSLSGCGPAYAYLIIESLADGAVKMGVPRAMATEFAAQVLVGAGQMVLQTGRHPGQLKDEVCSPGGTTIAGVHAMEKGHIRSIMMDAVEAATNKSHDINAKFS